ncbi:MAG: hypothetical protein PF795_00720 [Kiritimatiellae bacterium]|nr:hypothetical protein [Kiritimatiellia bacterium]
MSITKLLVFGCVAFLGLGALLIWSLIWIGSRLACGKDEADSDVEPLGGA